MQIILVFLFLFLCIGMVARGYTIKVRLLMIVLIASMLLLLYLT
jgi:hypothetical protein